MAPEALTPPGSGPYPMSSTDHKPTTGLPGLDRILKGLIPGDNIVWQVDDMSDYRSFVIPYAAEASARGLPLVYFRFASHPPLLDAASGAEIHEVQPEAGFEAFIDTIHRVIERAGRGAYYVFDCLSELAGDWYSDQMLGNFFMLTCPYLYDLETIAYFALLRDNHSAQAIGPISDTTQLLIEVLRHADRLYVRPIKVQQRHSPTMHLFHLQEGDEFLPVTSSAVISEIQGAIPWSGLRAELNRGFWERALAEAERVLREVEAGAAPPEAAREPLRHLLRMMISRDEAMLRLAEYLSLRDVVAIGRRMIGTGLVGGKTVGMLLARAILEKTEPPLGRLLETHDSFYVGSDVFYTFLVQNGVWWARKKLRLADSYLGDAEQARRRILTGKFPDYILGQFQEMLDYFGQSPFIVRSSSLLEDNFGNSFAGKYESVFCANQGPRERRLEDFLAAVRSIYASTMSERALRYRSDRGLLDRDEQMALLVMRVSGSLHGCFYFPAVAGVGFSMNPYAWNADIDPRSGVVRLVFGLGTRAVNRSDDDYTRLVALNAPERRPESNFAEIRQYAQRRVDYLDLEANQLVSGWFTDVAGASRDLPLHLLASEDASVPSSDRTASRVLTFDGLLRETGFVATLRAMLRRLEEAYAYPVDIEFTANFVNRDEYRINLVQCRPLQVQGIGSTEMPHLDLRPDDCLIRARGAVIGQSRVLTVQRLVYVVPARYGQLPLRDRYDVAHLLGRVNHAIPNREAMSVMLLGPGRWGTSTPSLGIPVVFPDINKVSVLCEIVAMRDDLVPDVSLGTHFLNELVETDMLYLALSPTQGDNALNEAFFLDAPNRLADLAPEAARWADTVRVIDVAALPRQGRDLVLLANAREQSILCGFRDRSPAARRAAERVGAAEA